jgi:Pectate lyase superfamily protein
MTALAQDVHVDGVRYAAGTDHTAMPALVVNQIRNGNAWVGGTPPVTSTPNIGKARITSADLSSAARARDALGLTGARVSVRSFGAKGDGVTDDSAAITAAEDFIVAAGGGVVFFPAGTYLTGPQTLHSYVVWEGDGPQISEVKLKSGANADLLKTKDYDILSGTNGVSGNLGCRGHGLRNISLNANRQNQTARSRCYATFGWNNTVNNVWFVNGHTIGVSSQWIASDSTGDHMEAMWSNFKIWSYGGVKGGAIGLDWSGPHDSIIKTAVIATLDSTIRPYHATYGSTPIDAGSGATATTPSSNATTFTFTTTQAAPTDLFPESGGSFLVPVDNGFSHFVTIVYTAASTTGNVTTFTGCTCASTNRTIGTAVANVGIIKPTYGLLANRVQRGEYSLLMDQVHIWGRNHVGVSGNVLAPPYNLDTTFAMSNCHIEGAFLVNVIMGTNSMFMGGAVYGTNGQVGNEYEVGIMMSVDNRGAEALHIDTVVFNVGKAGGPATCAPIINVNSGNYFLRATGTTNTTKFFSSANVYNQQSDVLVVCRNDVTKSVQWFGRSIAPIFHGGLQLGSVNNNTTGVRMYSGDGAPATSGIPAVVGDIYFRRDGTVGSLIYRATTVSGGVATAWTVVL